MKGVHHNRLIRDCIRVPSFRGIHTGIRVVDLNRAVARNASRNEEVTAIGEITRTYVNDHDEAVFEIANEACCGGREFLARKAKLSGIIADEFGLPKRFCQLLTARYGESLKKLASQLTEETFEISSVSDFRKAMCTSGGVDLSCIDLSTMQAKKLPGIYVIGEALDIDGITGGYNLQFAYSSACAAAAQCAGHGGCMHL